jgi:poly-gamma-glutamate capsule biosynthesis protein CapA/YwtB (metallophosphatase superfamily)
VRFANLEGPITARGRESEDTFVAAPSVAPWLRGRLDLVSLANNHALDQGREGRDDTVRILAEAGIAAATAERDARKKGVTLIARSSPVDERELLTALSRAPRPVLVSLHWGHTGSLLPSDEQRRLAARLIDGGATAVLGHGPHTAQGIERRGRGVIAYSLGNLAFSCDCTQVTDAFLLRFRIAKDHGADDVQLIPIRAGLAGEVPRKNEDPGLRELLDELAKDLAARPGG